MKPLPPDLESRAISTDQQKNTDGSISPLPLVPVHKSSKLPKILKPYQNLYSYV